MKTVQEQIKERLPIVEVLSSYVSLQESGGEYKGRCPFHAEKTASFYVSPDRGLYYCFGCGAKGDMFTFVQQFEGLDFKGALRVLAERAHVSLTHTSVSTEKADPLYAIHEKAVTFYQKNQEKETTVRAYIEGRGVNEKTIAAFQIGYAPLTWRSFSESCSPRELEVALDAGLVKKTEKGYYDRFRGRIMFPLADSSGRVIGFSGRLFPEEKDTAASQPKYLNSPETELFHKSDFLFGFDKAKFAIKKNNFAILVEGQMDLLLSHQAGFRNTVATSGTALSRETLTHSSSHLRALSRLTQNIILAFDGDTAGEHAVVRAAPLLYSLGMNVRVALLPKGKDPADVLSTEAPAVWKNYLTQSTSFFEHEVRLLLLDNPSPHTLVHRIRTNLFPSVQAVPSHIERGFALRAIAEGTGQALQAVVRDFEEYEKAHTKEEIETPEIREKEISMSAFERLTGVASLLPEDLQEKIQHMLAAISFHDHSFTPLPLENERTEELTRMAGRLYGRYALVDLEGVAEELIKKITHNFYEEVGRQLTKELREAETKKDSTESELLLQKLHELYSRMRS